MQGEIGFRRLVEDINICRGLGVSEVITFSLGRGLDAFGPDFIQRLAQAIDASTSSPVDFSFSRAGAITPYGASLWDAVLDLRGWRGLIVLGWCVIVIAQRLWMNA